MDFDLHFTAEDEEFRKEVRKFLEENIPEDLDWPVDPYDLQERHSNLRDQMRRKVGARGWFAPDVPKELGGGGLDDNRFAILAQEFNRINKKYGAGGASSIVSFVFDIMAGPILKHGTEWQKKEIVPAVYSGKIYTWLVETEPEHGTDNAALETTAIRDGDDYILNGTKIYIGQDTPYNWREAWFWTTAVTKPGAPRHENLGVFAHPADLPGIEEAVLPLIGAEAKKHYIYFKNARIPAKYLVGGPEQRGWDVLQASLRSEHGGGGRVIPAETVTEQVIQYCKEHQRNGKPLSEDPAVQDILVQLWMEDQKFRMYALSTYWLAKTHKFAGKEYKAVQGLLHSKLQSPKLAKALLEALGPYAVTGDAEFKVLRGVVERAERMGCVTHIAGTPEALKIMMSRGTGMTVPKDGLPPRPGEAKGSAPHGPGAATNKGGEK